MDPGEVRTLSEVIEVIREDRYGREKQLFLFDSAILEQRCQGGKRDKRRRNFLCRMEWDAKKWTCIPGNGQICALVTGPESFQAVCYGVLSEKKEIPLYSAERGIFIRFSPGLFPGYSLSLPVK